MLEKTSAIELSNTVTNSLINKGWTNIAEQDSARVSGIKLTNGFVFIRPQVRVDDSSYIVSFHLELTGKLKQVRSLVKTEENGRVLETERIVDNLKAAAANLATESPYWPFRTATIH